jgi:hypothetical protein
MTTVNRKSVLDICIIGPLVGLPERAGDVVSWRFEQRNERQ